MDPRLLLPFHSDNILNFIPLSCFSLSLFVQPSDGIDPAPELIDKY